MIIPDRPGASRAALLLSLPYFSPERPETWTSSMAILYLQCCAPKVLPGIASEVFNVVVALMMAVTSKIGLGSRSVV